MHLTAIFNVHSFHDLIYSNMKTRLLLLVGVIVWSISLQAQDLGTFLDKSDAFFRTYVRDNRVDYAAVKKNPALLDKLVDFIETAKVGDYTKEEYMSFGINSYNLLVIKTVVDNYPMTSPLEVSGFFDGIKVTVAGKKTTLNNYEKKELLQRYKDGGRSDATTFTLADGLSWRDPAGRTRTENALAEWVAKRASAGRMAPRGFPRDNTFT